MTGPGTGSAVDKPAVDKPFAPACERNRDPILAVLMRHFDGARSVLEIGSGTGQHAVHFAAAMPSWAWQCSDHPDALPGIRAWLDEAALPNTPPPVPLQSVAGEGLRPPADGKRFDAVFSANTLHIMGWPEVEALFADLPHWLAPDARVAVYGPFNRQGQYTSDSNAEFDAWLKARDGRSGLRDIEAVDALARRAGLSLVEDVAMPAHNRCVVWRHGS